MLTASFLTRVTYSLILSIISFAVFAQRPGNVTSTPLKLWFRADSGISVGALNYVREWRDVSGSGVTTVHPKKTENEHVIFHAAGVNFHPTVEFDGTRFERLAGEANNMGGTPTLFVICKPTNTQDFYPIFGNDSVDAVYSDPLIGVKIGPGAYVSSGYYVCDGNEAWITQSAGAIARVNFFDLTQYTYRNATNTTNTTMHLNGNVASNFLGIGKPLTSNVRYIEIGGRIALDAQYPGRIFQGDIAEIIYFTGNITENERLRVDTYLAIKYGLTLPHDYLSSNGQQVYRIDQYNQEIIGIGRDDAATLYQKQSHGTNYKTALILGYQEIQTTNKLNAFQFPQNNSYFIAGHDGASLTATEDTVSFGYISRLGRVWKGELTGMVIDNIVFRPSDEALAALSGTCDPFLMISNTPDFSANVQVHYLQNRNGFMEAVVPSLSGDTWYFTFGKEKPTNYAVSPTDLTACEGDSVQLTASGATNYLWLLAPGLSNVNISDPKLRVDVPVSLQVIMSDTKGCIDTLSVNVNVHPKPQVYLGIDTTICEDETIGLEGFDPNANFYQWSTGDNTSYIEVDQPGLYTLVVEDQYCGYRSSDTIDIRPKTKPVINTVDDVEVCPGVPVELRASGRNYDVIGWDTTTRTTIQVDIPSTHYIIAGNRCGTVSDTVVVKSSLCDGELYLPQAFTPNNDGLNDLFRGRAQRGPLFDYELKIFNRWGQLIFQTKRIELGWDGSFASILQASGTYVWMARFRKTPTKPIVHRKGIVTLIR